MTLYELFKTLHVLAAVAWVGGVIISQVLAAIAVKAARENPQKLIEFVKDQAWLGQRYFAPASIVVILAGVAMVIESGWNFSDLWIVIGIAIYLVSVVIGMFFLTPGSEKMLAVATERGVEDPETQQLAQRLTTLSRVDLVLLVLVVADMVVKPGA